jgi:diguanylate cyclase (GGDEF)-like protein
LVGICDIDYFKKINDSHGHQAGDEILCALVRCLQSNLREYDYVGRYGGEEFLIVISGSKGLDEKILFERLCKRIADSEMPCNAGLLKVTVSIGVARGTRTDTVDSVVARADVALYQAKNNGRNQVIFDQE